jgi:hypothetical protein
MKSNDLITLFESVLPRDLVFQCPENLSDEAKVYFFEARSFLLEGAARSYFNSFIRPIIAKQIEILIPKRTIFIKIGHHYFSTLVFFQFVFWCNTFFSLFRHFL